MTEAVDLAALAADAVPDEVVARLRQAREVLAVGHENPDADTLGATLALCRVVEAIGGRATAVFSTTTRPTTDAGRGTGSTRRLPRRAR